MEAPLRLVDAPTIGPFAQAGELTRARKHYGLNCVVHGQVAPADDFKGAREQLGENRQQFLSDSFQLPLFYTWN